MTEILCAKVGYVSRAAAKAEARRLRQHANGKGVRPYRCDDCPGLWHVGHLPHRVRRGQVTAGEAYGR